MKGSVMCVRRVMLNHADSTTTYIAIGKIGYAEQYPQIIRREITRDFDS